LTTCFYGIRAANRVERDLELEDFCGEEVPFEGAGIGFVRLRACFVVAQVMLGGRSEHFRLRTCHTRPACGFCFATPVHWWAAPRRFGNFDN
jgi:hypothetical protein